MSSSSIPQIIHDFFESSQIPLSLSDPTLPDDPLILANQAFYRMSGYSASEVLGSNCRFMQGLSTQKSVLKTIKSDLLANRDSRVLVRNCRKPGEEFDNFLFIFTIFDVLGTPIYRIGSQFEVPQISKSDAFLTHKSSLTDGIMSMNAATDITQQQLVGTGELVGVTVKSLLAARLDTLRSV